MAKKQIKRLNINSGVVDKLQKNNICTCQDFLSLTELQLLKILELPQNEIDKLTRIISRACMKNKVSTALELDSTNVEKPLSTSLPKLDMVIKGGLLSGSITEVTGPPGVGKTQFCIMMSLQAVMNKDFGGIDSGVIYIDTETSFTPQRFLEVAQHRYSALFENEEAVRCMAQKVYVYNAVTCEGLSEIIGKLETDIIAKKIKLIVIDSIASLVRKDFDMSKTSNRMERALLLNNYASMLKYVAESFNIPILVSNQITTRFLQNLENVARLDEELSSDVESSPDLELSYLTAALGNTWSHCVNTRLILQYAENDRRQILVAKSPVAPFAVFYYRITAGGIEDDDDNKGYVYQGTDPSLQRIRPKPGISPE